MERRKLTLSTYGEAIEAIERLEASGYRQLGKWDLAQICHHLSYYYRGSLNGFGFRLPWPIRKTIGRMLLKRMLAGGDMKTGGRTIPASIPPTPINGSATVAEAKALLARLQLAEQLHASPLFDQLSPDQWKQLHLAHTAHHLSFLMPKASGE